MAAFKLAYYLSVVLITFLFPILCSLIGVNFQELERLSQKFGENVLDATKKFEKLITDKKEVEGLPATALALAAQTAVSKVLHVSRCSNFLEFFYKFQLHS